MGLGKLYFKVVKISLGYSLEYGKLRGTKHENNIWTQASHTPCFMLWRVVCCFVNGILTLSVWPCGCVRTFVYELSHCFHFRKKNKINPFDIPEFSVLGCNSWWIVQIWQRALSALKLHFSTNKWFAGRSLPTLVRIAKFLIHFKPEEEPVWVFFQLSFVLVKDMASFYKHCISP